MTIKYKIILVGWSLLYFLGGINCKSKQQEKDTKQLISSIPNKSFKNNYISLNLPDDWIAIDTGVLVGQLPGDAIYQVSIIKEKAQINATIHLIIYSNFSSANDFRVRTYDDAKKNWNLQSTFTTFKNFGNFLGDGFYVETKMVGDDIIIMKLFGGQSQNNFIGVMEEIDKKDYDLLKDEVSLIENTLTVETNNTISFNSQINDDCETNFLGNRQKIIPKDERQKQIMILILRGLYKDIIAKIERKTNLFVKQLDKKLTITNKTILGADIDSIQNDIEKLLDKIKKGAELSEVVPLEKKIYCYFLNSLNYFSEVKTAFKKSDEEMSGNDVMSKIPYDKKHDEEKWQEMRKEFITLDDKYDFNKK